MTHEDLCDSAMYAWKASRNYDPKLDRFIVTYHRETEPPYPRISLNNKTEEAMIEPPKIEPRDLEWDFYQTDRLNEWIKEQFNLTKEKENKTMATDRELMHSLKKGMLVERLEVPNDRGYIEAFDYTHALVGVRMVGVPSYANLRWINPNYLRVITTLDGTATQQTLAYKDAGGNWVVRESTNCPKPKKVVYNEDAGVMVVIWMDGQKTIVRPAEDEDMNPYDAFCAAYCKRVFGSNSALKRELEKVLVIEKPKAKKKATPMPTSELGKAIKDFKEKITEAMVMNKHNPNYDN